MRWFKISIGLAVIIIGWFGIDVAGEAFLADEINGSDYFIAIIDDCVQLLAGFLLLIATGQITGLKRKLKEHERINRVCSS